MRGFIPYEIGHGQKSNYLLQLPLSTNIDFIVLNIFLCPRFRTGFIPYEAEHEHGT